MRRLLLIIMTGLLLLTGCGAKEPGTDGDGMRNSYRQISQEEAAEMMRRDDGHVVVDVRRQDEYDAGHIPGAILIPNETIGTSPPKELPDPDQIILIYCRSGNRSKQAAQKLFDMGYTNLYEFGGIITWTGEIVTGREPQGAAPPENNEVRLSFDSFDGGGPEFSVQIADPEIVSCTRTKQYDREDHDEMTGAGYSVTFTFCGRKAGEATVTISARSPIAENFDACYAVTVDDALNISMRRLEEDARYDAIRPMPTLVIEANGRIVYGSFENNRSAEALAETLSHEALEIDLREDGGFAKTGPLPWSLPQDDAPITARAGDVALCQGDQIAICYDETKWSFTRLARIGNVTTEKLMDLFGDGDVTVKLWVEWSE